MLGIAVHQCKLSDLGAKSLVERNKSYYETSFLPGRSFTSPDDFNAQFSDWPTSCANQRQHRAVGSRPIDRWEADRAAMLALPPAPSQLKRGRQLAGRGHRQRTARPAATPGPIMARSSLLGLEERIRTEGMSDPSQRRRSPGQLDRGDPLALYTDRTGRRSSVGAARSTHQPDLEPPGTSFP